MTKPLLSAWLLLGAFGAVGLWNVWPRPSLAIAKAPEAPPEPGSQPQFQGVASCAAQPCHHGNGPRGEKRSEYSTWITSDKHARAYLVLLEQRSRKIEANFKNLKDVKEAHPEKDPLCLNCHVQPNYEKQKEPPQPRFSVLDGVGCENCHGAAEKWLSPHVTWSTLAPEDRKREYDRHGMTWLRDLDTRIHVCVSCHVGTARQEVNHDLIAAGHPRLNFEYSAYLAATPRHWSAQEEKARYPDFAARAWAIGQVVCARAALELLAARAQAKEKPWPELAEYNCFACHHELRDPSWRRQRGYQGLVPGSLSWGDWYFAALPQALALRKTPDAERIPFALNELQKEMRKPLPEAGKIAQQARIATGWLKTWLEGAEKEHFNNPDQLQQALTALQKDERLSRSSWDGATQRYLGMNALVRALEELGSRQQDPQLKTYLQELNRQLQFPQGHESPRDFVPK